MADSRARRAQDLPDGLGQQGEATNRTVDAECRALADALLAALADMAGRSPRRQADVAVAVRRSGLRAPPDQLAAALDLLLREGCVSGALHLSDGGILVAITARGIEHLATTAFRHVVIPFTSPDLG